MKARIRRISTSVDTVLSPTSSSTDQSTMNNNQSPSSPSSSSAAAIHSNETNLMPDSNYCGQNPVSSKSLDICATESRIERMRKLLSSPLLKRKNASSHHPQHHHQQPQHYHNNHHYHHHYYHHHHYHQQQQLQHQHHHGCSSNHNHQNNHNNSMIGNNRMQQQQQLPQPSISSSSTSSSPSSSPALGQNISMKTFGVSLESLSHHQHPHHHQHQQQLIQQQQQYVNYYHCMEDYYVRDPEQIVVPHQKAAHILGQACPGCLTSAPSNSSSTGSINDTAGTSSGHFSPHGNHTEDLTASLSSIVATTSPSSGNSSSSSTTSSTGGAAAVSTSAGGVIANQNIPCLIPFIVTRLCTFIENSGGLVQEGLFRISGNAKLVDKLKQSFDNYGDAPLETDGDLAAAAALLKQFLRELPQPLIPNGSQFLDVIRSLKNDHETCVLSLKALVSQLPDENYYTLRYLIRFLHRIAQRNDENRMTSTNLGIVFAPNIFRVCVDSYQGLKDQSSANEVVNLLITDYVEIFNETNDNVVGGIVDRCHSVDGAGGGGSSGDLSFGSETQCPCVQCPQNNDNDDDDTQPQSSDVTNDEIESIRNKSMTTDTLNVPYDEQMNSIQNEIISLEVDKKRKSYQCKNNHHTIDDHTILSQSLDFDVNNAEDNNQTIKSSDRLNRSNDVLTSQRPNNEQSSLSSMSDRLLAASSCSKNENDSNSRTNLPSNTMQQPHEIIITNSSDSVSTDDNTTTATSTGRTTVRSVIVDVEKVDICGGNGGGGDMTDISEDNFINSSHNLANQSGASASSNDYEKLLTVSKDNNMNTPGINQPNNNNNKGSNSCGSDCTEMVNNMPTILSFTSDDDEDDDDSLLKSIASECSDGNDQDDQDDDDRCSSSSDDKKDAEDPKNEPENGDDQRSNDNQGTDENQSQGPKALIEENRIENNEQKPSDDRSSITDTSKEQIENREDESIERISIRSSKHRRLQSIRRKLKQFEIDFEQENGYEASLENKLSSSFARPLILELNQLLNQSENNVDNQKSGPNSPKMIIQGPETNSDTKAVENMQTCKNTSATTSSTTTFTTDDIFNTIFGNRREKSLQRISEMMEDIQRSLNEKRTQAKRPESLDSMTMEQIFDEKLALQKALLRFEALCGRPSSKAERNIVRPVYDRYRQVKRYASKLNQKNSTLLQKLEMTSNNDLQTIIENVQMNFQPPPTTPHHQMMMTTTLSPNTNNIESIDTNTCDMNNAVKNTSNNNDKNYHCMSHSELSYHLNELRQQKRQLRSVLRTFENDFYKKTGRHVEKEDRCNMSSIYASYKTIKGKIKLIEALLAKKMPKSI